MTTGTITAFDQLDLAPPLLKALDDVGYETPSPIQAQTIPPLLAGSDVLGQAQTGTGKTAAFALPLLSTLDLTGKQPRPQVLVLTPTRELAIQVAEAFQRYASHMKKFRVIPIYGGQDYRGQIRALERGVHVVVGTPGRVMDHMRRGTLALGELKTLVLDEADEMLRMGFIDDVEWILEQTPAQRQTALFSATLPAPIRRIAARYMSEPTEITIKQQTRSADTIRQRFWSVSGVHKLDALTRILEAETFDAMIVFVRTKTATVELSEKLEARGFASAPLSGDVAQKIRERTVEQLKKGKLDILVATDVAARGLDVDRVSHVINYDIPYDTEAYIHRIGRTGRAGRSGEAILFVAPRERRLLFAIEKATKAKIERMELPTAEQVNDQRIARFNQRISDALASGDLGIFPQLIERYRHEHNVPAVEIAAALALLLQGDTPLLLADRPEPKTAPADNRSATRQRPDAAGASTTRPRFDKDKSGQDKKNKKTRQIDYDRPRGVAEPGMESYRIEVGHDHDVKPGNIVGAIANEAGLDSQHIGRIDIRDDHSLIDLPEGMPKDIFKLLKKVWVSGQQLQISRFSGEPDTAAARPKPAGKPPRRAASGPKTRLKPKRDDKPKRAATPKRDKQRR